MFVEVDSVMAAQTEEEFAVILDEAIERSLAEPELIARVHREVKRKHIIIHSLFVLNLICT